MYSFFVLSVKMHDRGVVTSIFVFIPNEKLGLFLFFKFALES